MCGIAGFWGKGQQDDLERMIDALSHRGPDGDGRWISSDAALFIGHRRLAIIDLEGGYQPMSTRDEDLIVTFNGEIYNHIELRRELEHRGHEFRSHHSDTEVLLHAYREWGDSMVDHLNGMWAFALVDVPRRRLLLSRDRFGEKPLFYTHQRGLFAFASELSSLRQHRSIGARLSDRGLQKLFAYGYVPAPLSIFEGINKLPAGCSLVFSLPTEEVVVSKYWDFIVEPFEKVPSHPEVEWGEELVRLLQLSVKRRLMADVDLGVFLSGGIDSSVIASLAAAESTAPVSTFTIGFDDRSFDESSYADLVSRFIGSKHHVEVLSLDKRIQVIPDIIAGLDEPIGDSSLIPTWLLSKMARAEVKVVLGGDGGDELFAGYDPFEALARARLYSKVVPRPVHQGISALAGLLPVSHRYMSIDFKVKRTLGALGHPMRLWPALWMAPVSPEGLYELFGTRLSMEDLYSEAVEAWEGCQQESPVDRLSQFFVKLYLQDDILVKTDRASMMHGLEVRAPFLDVELVDFVRRIPWQYKYRRGHRKYLLNKAVRGLVPDSIISRRKKGFGVPIGRWFQEGKLGIEPEAGPPALDRGFVARAVNAHLEGRADNRLFLWNHWVLTHMDLQERSRTGSDH